MPDTPSFVAFYEGAPPAEQRDAMTELTKAFVPTSSATVPTEGVRAVYEYIQRGLEQQGDWTFKANASTPARIGGVPSAGVRSILLDEQSALISGDYYEKGSAMGFDLLRDMVLRTPLLSAICTTRCRQVSRFCQESEDGGLGFEIVHRDPKEKLSGDDLELATQLRSFFSNCGWEDNPRQRKRLKRTNLTQFMMKSCWDSLAMDSAPIETEMRRGRNAGMDGFYAVDGSTIRLCTESGYNGDDEIFALQVIDGRVVTPYTYDQLVYEVRNPRTDVRLQGYGLAEPEMMIQILTGWLNAIAYNTRGFDQNAIPKGVLHLVGNYSSEDLTAFKRYLGMMTKGVTNAFSMPVLVSKDQDSKASFEKFNVEFNEMAFAKWVSLTTSVACALYAIAPEEINFDSFSSTSSTLGSSDPESKLTASKDKGLRPFLGHYEAMFSDFFVSEFTKRLCFRWRGLDEEDPKQKWEEDKTAMTWGELRKRRGDGPLKDPEMEDLPLNPSFMSAWTQKRQEAQQAAQQQQNQPDYGAESPDGGDFGSGSGDGADQDDSDQATAAAEQGASVDDGGPGAGDDDQGGGDGAGEQFGKALDALLTRMEF